MLDVRHVREIHHQVHAVRPRLHVAVRVDAAADEDDDLPAPLVGGDLERGVEDGIALEIRVGEVLGDDDDIVSVRLELHHDVLGEKPGVNFAPQLREIIHHEPLHLRHIHADERGRVPRFEEINPMVKFVVGERAHLAFAKDCVSSFMPEVSTESSFMRFFASST